MSGSGDGMGELDRIFMALHLEVDASIVSHVRGAVGSALADAKAEGIREGMERAVAIAEGMKEGMSRWTAYAIRAAAAKTGSSRTVIVPVLPVDEGDEALIDGMVARAAAKAGKEGR